MNRAGNADSRANDLAPLDDEVVPDPENIFDPLHAVPEVEEDAVERIRIPPEYSGDIGYGPGIYP